MQKIIVTGANGFLGTYVCQELVASGYEVYALVRNSSDELQSLKQGGHLHVVFCDMNEYQNLPDLMEGIQVDTIYHFAWAGTAGKLRGDYELQVKNIKNSCDLMEACMQIGCRRFVFAASIMEYEVAAMMKGGCKLSINTLYSSAKLSADYMLKALAGKLGIEYLSGMISNVYGPGEVSDRLINSSIRKLLRGERCSFSSGEQQYDFIYITDAAKAFVAIGEEGKEGKEYYIGSPKPMPLKEFLIIMCEELNACELLGLGDLQFNGVTLDYTTLFDLDAINMDTGFVPGMDFRQGIKNTIHWIRSNDYV